MSEILLQNSQDLTGSSGAKFAIPKYNPVSGDPVAPADDVYTWSKLMYLSLIATILAIVGLSVNWYFIRIISAPLSPGNGTMAPTAGPSSQVSYDFSLTSVTTTLLDSRSIRSYDQFILPDVQATFLGVRACVIIGLVAALFTGLNFMILSQGWLQSSLSFYVAKHWYRIQMPIILPAFGFLGAVCSVLALLALPPAFVSDDVLIQLNNPLGGSYIPIQTSLSCANSKAIIDCSLLFESNTQVLTAAQFNTAHRPVAGWWVMLFSSLLALYIFYQAFVNRLRLKSHIDAALRVEEDRESEMAQSFHNNFA